MHTPVILWMSSRSRLLSCLALTLAHALLTAALAGAQVPGHLIGAISDPTGGPLPGASITLRGPVARIAQAPEWAWSHEAGVKAVAFGGRARLTAAAFQTDYRDLQVQTVVRPGILDISNAAAATIRGVEWEGTARLAPWLNAGGHLAWLRATYDRYVAVGAGGATVDVAGRRLSNAPEWSGRLWLESRADLGRIGSLSARVDARRQSTVFYTPFNDAIQRQRAYGLLDASVELVPHGRRWSVGIYSQNLTNERYITGTFGSPPPAIGGRPGEPRRMAVEFGIRR